MQSANRPQRIRSEPVRFRPDTCHAAVEHDPDEPRNEHEALSGPATEQWRAAMDEEIQSLVENSCWEIQELPPGAKAIGCRWVFKVKRDAKGNIERYKARLVAKGFTQREHIDFEEVYAPVSQYATLRAFLSTVADQDLEVRQVDIKTAFLNGDLEEELYMQQPPGYHLGGRAAVCRLLRAIYGLRQAGRAWHAKLLATLLSMGFLPSEADASLFHLKLDGDLVLVIVYVDDMLIASRSLPHIEHTIDQVLSAFKGTVLGEPALFLGMQITRDRQQRTLTLNQERYTLNIVKRFDCESGRYRPLPLAPGVQLQSTGQSMTVDESLYAEALGCLLYLASCTRPDIAQAVSSLARFMSAPKQQHWQAAMNVLRYLAGSAAVGITYGGASGLSLYTDSDYAGDIDTRRSRTGFVGVLNGGAIVWASKLQPTVAASTCEAEYMAQAAGAREALWLRKLLPDLGYPLGPKPVTIYGDNESALKLTKNPLCSTRSKHIDVLHHIVRDRAARGEIKFEYISTKENPADALTKSLPVLKFNFCCSAIGLG